MTKTYLAWLAAAAFYYYQYILRVSPGVMVTELRHDFHLTAEEFSSLGAFYLYAYSLLQIPLGILIDRIGIRRTVLGSIVLCILGTVTLSYADHLYTVQLSRILVGIGSAGAFMSALKIAADWLPQGKRGFLIGATLTLGTVGAMSAGKPLVFFLDAFGWRTTTLWCAALGIVIFAIVWVLLKLPEVIETSLKTRAHLKNLPKHLKEILGNPSVMIYAVLAIGLYTPLSVLADLWGTAFLMQKYSLARANAAEISMMMYLGLAVGSLLLPWISEKYHVLDGAIKLCGLGIFLSFAVILFGPNLSPLSLIALLTLLGVFCGAEMMCFTGAVLHTTRSNSGRTLGVVNTLNMLGGAILQQLIGYALDVQWHGEVDASGIRVYNTQEFVMALSLLLVVVGCCCLISLRLKKRAQV